METCRNQYAHYKLSVEDIMEKYNWLNIANGIEARPGTPGRIETKNNEEIVLRLRDWDWRDSALRSFLILSLPTEWKSKFEHVPGGGYELWQAIVNEFEREILNEHTILISSLYNISQDNDESLVNYIKRIKTILSELERKGDVVSDEAQVMCFFQGLNYYYKPEEVELLMEQKMTLEQAFTLIREFTASKQSVRPVSLPSLSAEMTSSNNSIVGADTGVTNHTGASSIDADATTFTTIDPCCSTTAGITTSTTAGTSNSAPMQETAHRTAYRVASLHRGLKNDTGENNCFLNVTIQALWHLGPFRVHLTSFIQEHSLTNSANHSNNSHNQSNNNNNMKGRERTGSIRIPAGGILEALCNLFMQYEFTDLDVLPATELRESLSLLSDSFQLGEYADACEAFDTILQRIHLELCSACPQSYKCLSHEVFGGCIMEQSVCSFCQASSEPTVRSDFILCFQAAELLLEAKALFAKSSQTFEEGARSDIHTANSNTHTTTTTHNTTAHNNGNTVHNSTNSSSSMKSLSGFARFLHFGYNPFPHMRIPHLLHHHQQQEQQQVQEKGVDAAVLGGGDGEHHYTAALFGQILSKCMTLSHRSCPSSDAYSVTKLSTENPHILNEISSGGVAAASSPIPTTTANSTTTGTTTSTTSGRPTSYYHCRGKATVHQYSLDPPLALALSIGWTQERESTQTLQDFYALIAYSIQLSDIFRVQGNTTASNNGGSSGNDGSSSASTSGGTSSSNPSYVFRGLVCYYGKHYVSIFQSRAAELHEYLLFDDHRVINIGSWEAVKQKCVKSCYQPVLLLYELEADM